MSPKEDRFRAKSDLERLLLNGPDEERTERDLHKFEESSPTKDYQFQENPPRPVSNLKNVLDKLVYLNQVNLNH